MKQLIKLEHLHLVLFTDNVLVKFIALLINKLSQFFLQDHFTSHYYCC